MTDHNRIVVMGGGIGRGKRIVEAPNVGTSGSGGMSVPGMGYGSETNAQGYQQDDRRGNQDYAGGGGGRFQQNGFAESSRVGGGGGTLKPNGKSRCRLCRA